MGWVGLLCLFVLSFNKYLGTKDVKAETSGTNSVIYENVFQGPFLTSWDSWRTIEAYLR